MKKFINILSGLVIVASSLLGGALVFAQESQDSTGSGLIISPTRTELEISPGESGVVPITIRNVANGEVIAEAEINDFISDDSSGRPQIIPNAEERQVTSIANFITNLEDIELGIDEKRDIELNVSVPKGTPAGAYYGVVRYTAIPKNQSQDERQISLSASLGSLVLITVPGDIREEIAIERTEILDGDEPGTFFTGKPTAASITIKNNGNGFSKPFGRVQIMRGDKQVYSYELNSDSPRANVLPGSNRAFVDEINGIDMPGRYKLVANISQNDGGEVLTTEIAFWYIPVWLLAVAAVFVILIIVAGYIVYRTKFRSKRR